MKMLPRITEIIKVEPFKITCRWNTAEVRVIGFEKNSLFFKGETSEKLLDFQVFKYVSISESRTLQWVNLPVKHRFLGENGSISDTESPFTLDPDNLYKQSQSIEEYVLVWRGTMVA